jgi:hypothetical protein
MKLIFANGILAWAPSESNEYRDARTGAIISITGRPVFVPDQLWKSILLTTPTGFFVLIMQDQNWILEMKAFPENADRSVPAIQAQTFGPGLEPALFPGFLTVPVEQIVTRIPNTVTLYHSQSTPGGVVVRGSDGQYYDLVDGRPVETQPEESIQMPINFTDSIYTFLQSQVVVIQQIDRYGDSRWIDEMGTQEDEESSSLQQIRMPRSLRARDNEITLLEVHENLVAIRIILYMRANDIYPHEYSEAPQKRIYFVWSNPTPWFRANQEGEFLNLDTGEERPSIPLGRLTVLLDHGDEVLLIQGREAFLLNKENGAVEVEDSTTIADHPLGTKVFPLGAGVQPFVEQLRQLISSGVTIGSGIRLPIIRNSDEISARESLDRLIAVLNNQTVPEPAVIGDYTRAILPVIQELLSMNQIVKFEVPVRLQPFAGPPPYHIITFETRDGRKLFVRARYNFSTNQILP